MPYLFVVASTFVACALLIIAIYWLFVVRPEGQAAAALRRRLEGKAVERPASTNDLTKKDTPFSAFNALDSLLAHSGRFGDPLKRVVEHSGLKMSVGVVLLACGFCATVAIASAAIATGSLAVAFLLALVAGSLPYFVVKQVADRRLKRMEEQLPQAV